MLMDFNTGDLPPEYKYLAPDGSEIRLTFSMTFGSVCHCRLPTGGISKAVRHKTVEEFWYFIKGTGEVWRQIGTSEVITAAKPGIGLNIATGTHFQFRNTGSEALEFLIYTMPPWTDKSEAVEVDDKWVKT